MQIMELPVDAIEPFRNDRTRFDEDEIRALAISIERNGLAQPITVRQRTDDIEGYWLVAGERRWRAHRLIQATTIRAIVAELDEDGAASITLVENTARVNLNAIEEAKAYRHHIEVLGRTIEDVAEVAGKEPAHVRWRLALLTLTPEYQSLVESGNIGPDVAYQMRELDPDRQRIAMRALNSGNMSVTDLRILCDKLRMDQQQGNMFDPDDFMQIEEYVAEAKRENVALTAKQLIDLSSKVLAAILHHVDRDELSPSDLADLDHLERAIEHRQKGAKK